MPGRHTAACAVSALIAALPSVVCFAATPAPGKAWPQRPVRFVLGFPAGGASDIVARALGQRLTETWGEQVVIDNRPGATGLIASELAAQATPDGYTVLLISSSYANNIILKPKLASFDPLKDLIPVMRIAAVPNIAVVPTSLPVHSLPELIALAKEKPGSLSYASGGAGTGTHLATELLKLMAQIDMVHVPYKGTPPALIDLMANRVQLMLAGGPPALPHVRAGRLRAIGVTSAKRTPSLPDVPSFSETLPGYEATTWYGFMVPAGTPNTTIGRINADVRRALDDSGVKKALADSSFDPEPSTPEEFGAYIRSEIDKWGKVVKAAHIQGM